jgi:hypothetical protein
MQGFLRTITIALAGLCILLLTAGGVVLWKLKSAKVITPEKAREWVLTKEELTWLKQMKEAPPEPPPKVEPVKPPPAGGMEEQELVTRIAERANADRATALIADLRRQKQSLDERQAYIDRQNAELEVVRADLDRLKRQMELQTAKTTEERAAIEAERAAWANAQAANAQGIQRMGEAEQARYREQAKLYEQMKDAAWQSLKRLEPKEIARYLSLMEQKKAAKLLTIAGADSSVPADFTTRIHQSMLTLDLANVTEGQAGRLAMLYGFMKPPEVAGYLKNSSPEEIADILRQFPDTKKRAGLLEALRAVDADRAMDAQRVLGRVAP